ncbi:MAG TPA: hypothetical protein VF551_00195 [Chthoniobacterales bacterium]
MLCAVSSIGLSVAFSADDEEETPIPFHGPDVHAGYPDAFHVGYVLRPSALSPNKRYGIIYPKRFLEENPGADFVVDVPASRALAVLETDSPYFSGRNHGSIAVYWAPDSSAALVENGGKWMPRNLLLVELKDGAVVRQTDLLDPLLRVFAPAIAKAERSRASEASPGELSIKAVKWKNGRGAQLEFRCEGGTNPKGFPDSSAWAGKAVATWDVAQHKFVQQTVTQTSFRKAGKAEDE